VTWNRPGRSWRVTIKLNYKSVYLGDFQDFRKAVAVRRKALQFEHDEVQGAGYAAEDAERIGLGWHPQYKVLFVGHRSADGSWSGFSKLKDGKLTPPPRWIVSTVVPFQKRA
jgi:hypothetical protein